MHSVSVLNTDPVTVTLTLLRGMRKNEREMKAVELQAVGIL